MPAQPISMRKLKDVLRLKYDAGLSQRQIAAALGLSVGVVNKYLNAAQAAELNCACGGDTGIATSHLTP